MTTAERVHENEGLSTGLAMLRRRWPTIVGVVLVCLIVGVARHERAAKSYSATANVAFRSVTLSQSALQINTGGSGDPVRDASTEVLIARSQQVAANVQRDLHSRESASTLLDDVKVEAADNADVLNISATTGDPTFSARLANAFANEYIRFKVTSDVQSITASQNQLRQQINALPAGSSDRTALQQSLQRLSELKAVAGGGASIIGLASPPSAPAGAGLSTTVLISLLIGLAVALSIVFLLESLDRRIKSVEEFERQYRLPAIATIPQSSFRHGRADERTEDLEPYRILRSSLDLAAVTRDIKTLLVTSATEGEGKTTVAVDLAHAAGLDGRRVVLVELDLRRPTFAKHFGLDFRRGVTLALAGGLPAEEMLVEPFLDLPNLAVLPSGPLPPNPAELLSSPAVREMLMSLAPKDGLLIVDAPPINPVADTQELLTSGAVDASLIVGRVNKTNRDDASRARAILARHMVEPLGLVVTGVRGAAGYGYDPYQPPAMNGDIAPRRRPASGRLPL